MKRGGGRAEGTHILTVLEGLDCVQAVLQRLVCIWFVEINTCSTEEVRLKALVGAPMGSLPLLRMRLHRQQCARPAALPCTDACCKAVAINKSAYANIYCSAHLEEGKLIQVAEILALCSSQSLGIVLLSLRSDTGGHAPCAVDTSTATPYVVVVVSAGWTACASTWCA